MIGHADHVGLESDRAAVSHASNDVETILFELSRIKADATQTITRLEEQRQAAREKFSQEVAAIDKQLRALQSTILAPSRSEPVKRGRPAKKAPTPTPKPTAKPSRIVLKKRTEHAASPAPSEKKTDLVAWQRLRALLVNRRQAISLRDAATTLKTGYANLNSEARRKGDVFTVFSGPDALLWVGLKNETAPNGS